MEDAPYRPLRYRGKEEPSIYSLAPERTLFMCSFTKLIAPGVRTGFMIGRPDLIAKLAKVAEDTTSRLAIWRRASPTSGVSAACWQPQIERLKALTCRDLTQPGGARQSYAGCGGCAARRRVLHLADVA